VPGGALAWFQILVGGAALERADGRDEVTQDHVVFLPPGFDGALASAAGATLLFATVPDAARFDPAFGTQPLVLRIVDWTREPVLQSEHDARKRIYLVTPKLFATKAIKGEMIIYPPGTEAANHHHQGAAHFMYILGGRGTCYANEQPFGVRMGDIVYYGDCERHYLRSDPEVEMRFVEFFVPGQYKTVWVEEAKVCAWIPQGRNIRGEKAAREIQAHTSAAPSADI
jgi:mannose-6-phosphate isomerase-like protein (cupin superfamily)